MKLSALLPPEAILPDMYGSTSDEAMGQMAGSLCARDPDVDLMAVSTALERRDSLASATLGAGLAVLHAKLPGLRHLVGALGRSPTGIAFGAPDGRPTHLFILLAGPEQSNEHVAVLDRIGTLFRDGALYPKLLAAPDAAAIAALLAAAD